MANIAADGQATPALTIRAKVNAQLELARGGKALSATNKVLIALILLATTLGVLETEPTLARRFEGAFGVVEAVLGGAGLGDRALPG
jgi:hypothetical protein